MIKKLLCLFVLINLLTVNVFCLDKNSVSAECAVLINQKTGEIIFEKNAFKRHSMASTTKIMTALLAVESGLLSNEFIVDENSIKVEGTSMGLQKGDTVSLLDLTYGMLLSSGNDAANACAAYLCGNVENFALKMNGKAKSIGMTNTNFVTPSGLDDERHYSTAYDMALLGAYAVGNPQFLDICSSKKIKLKYGNPPYDRWLYNHNKLLEYYDCSLGIKTGFTKKSGRCLVSYARKDNVGLIAVTLNDKNDWHDHKLMLDFGFENIKNDKLTFDLPEYVDVVGGSGNTVKINSISYDTDYYDKNLYSYKIYLQKFLYAPVYKNDIIGRADIYYKDKIIDSVSLTSASDVKGNNNGR